MAAGVPDRMEVVRTRLTRGLRRALSCRVEAAESSAADRKRLSMSSRLPVVQLLLRVRTGGGSGVWRPTATGHATLV